MFAVSDNSRIAESGGSAFICFKTSLIAFQERVKMEKKGSKIWPAIYDLQSAKDAMIHGMFASGILATISIGFFIVSLFLLFKLHMLNMTLVVNGIFFLSIGLGIYKKSRVVSILGFAIYITDRIYHLINSIKSNSIGIGFIIYIIVALCLIASIRGVIFYHKLRKSHIIKKNVVILNLLALLYSIIALFAVSIPAAYFFPSQFLEVINESWSFKDELAVLGFCSFAIAYILTLMKVMPLTKKRETVCYEISEEELKDVEKVKDDNREYQKSIADRGRLDG